MKPFQPPTAYATRVILIICAGLQLLSVVMGPGFDQSVTLAAGLVPARLTGDVIGLKGAIPAPLTLVSHMFLHSGLVHLAMNMVFLAWAGRQVEWLLGPARLVILFLLGGIVGGLMQVAINPSSIIPVVGASGGISAIFATYALLFARDGEAPARLFGLVISAETVRAFRYAALWIGLQLLTAIAFNLPGAGGIAIWSHIGGFLVGLLFGLPLVRSRGGRPS
ncbi:rhomboid family intramembrane serine protease [Sandaracinobacteroides sp. A072]|uniref:rhomboid family intramembrane serine protease n=1 Tax=Sandaracinobacteroides sp. A072 TaxID=3461146 RepID=UPI004042A3EF